MNFFPNESMISSLANGTLTVTQMRVVHEYKVGGVVNYSSVHLDNVSSVRYVSYDHKGLLYVSIAFFLLGALGAATLSENRLGPFVGGAFMGAVFLVAYFATRKQRLEIHAVGSESISVVAAEGHEACTKFLSALENQMNNQRLASMNPFRAA